MGIPEAKLDPRQLVFERGGDADEGTFMRILQEVVSIVEDSGIPYALMGGLASASMGRPRWTHDIDLFVEEQNAKRVLDLLEQYGYETQRTYPEWLYKGLKDSVLVDVIFRSSGGIVLDEEMIRRAKIREHNGMKMRTLSAEDLVVIKAVVHDEHVSRHWFDALGIIAHTELDWDYLLQRPCGGRAGCWRF